MTSGASWRLERTAVVARDAHIVARRVPGRRSRPEARAPRGARARAPTRARAGRHRFGPVRALVQTPLATRRRTPLEVLDDVRDEDRLAIDPGGLERLVEDPAGRTDERRALDVLVVARLLPDHHPASRHRALPEDGLRRPRPQVAGPTPGGRSRRPSEVQIRPSRTSVEDVHGSRVDRGAGDGVSVTSTSCVAFRYARSGLV